MSQPVASTELQFRTAPAVSASDAGTLIGLSMAVILVFVLVTVALKRVGLLQRWLAPALDARLRVVAAQRIGMGTTLHLVEVDGEQLLVVESARQVAVERLTAKPPQAVSP